MLTLLMHRGIFRNSMNEIKEVLMKESRSVSFVARLIGVTAQGLNRSIRTDAIKHRTVKSIMSALGYEIRFVKKGQSGDSSENR